MLTMTVCAALSAAGLAVALLTAWRRRFAAATRIAAFALFPVGLAMSGLLGLAGKVVRAVGSWAAGLVLDPTVWAGFAVLACAVVLWVAARVAGRRSSRAGGRASAPGAGTPQGSAEPKGASGSLPPSEKSGPKGNGGSGGGGDDFSEIEEILKKHGI